MLVNFRRALNSSTRLKRTSVACMLIADEILSGKIQDSNSHFLARQCFQRGLRLERVITIPDAKPDIISTIHELSSNYDLVVTCGGVGPTHDDLTYASIAEAYGLHCKYHQATLDRMEWYMTQRGNELTEDRKRMALIPDGSQVYYSFQAPTDELRLKECDDSSIIQSSFGNPIQNEMAPTIWTPVVKFRNVVILPGPPSIFQPLLTSYLDAEVRSMKRVVRKVVGTRMAEGDLAAWLRTVSEEFKDIVHIGSYPQFPPGQFTVILTFEGDDETDVDECIKRTSLKIPIN